MQFEILQGALAGLIFGLGALLIAILPKYKWAAASALCVIITPLALLPFWFSTGDLGISDWDYYFSMHTNIRTTIMHYGQFPLWNPYICGGTSALGDPEFPALSPLFLLELLFGTPAGLRLSIYASTAIGALGMLHLSRKLGIGVLGGLIAVLGMSFGTVNLLEIVEGHQNILAAMYIPWVLLCWYSAYSTRTKKRMYWIVGMAALLALIFFQGGIYLLMYLTGAFIFLIIAVPKRQDAIKITLASGIIALGITGIKLVPVALWLTQFQDTAYASSAFTIWNIKDILLGRIVHGAEDIILNQGSGWHEYGAYVGPVLLTLAGIGIVARRKRRVVQVLVVGGMLALLISASGPFLKPFFDAVSFIPRSNISRLILFTVMAISLLAGFGVNAIAKRSKRMNIYAIILITLAAIDVMSLAYPLASQTFVLPHVTHTIADAPYPIAYSPYDYKTRYNGNDYTRAYDATLKGYGTMSYCSVLGPDPAVRIITDEGGSDILSFPNDKLATFRVKKWTPNKAIFEIATTKPTTVVLNANYARGWFANKIAAQEIGNRVGQTIQPGTSIVEFSYVPPGMYAGLIITILTCIGIGYILFRK